MQSPNPQALSGIFDFDAGALCLDFANTLDWHASATPEEELTSYPRLVTWGMEAGLLSLEEAVHLELRGVENPAAAAHWLAEAIRLREALYRVFVAIAYTRPGGPADPADLAIITEFWQQAAQSMRLEQAAGAFHWQWALQADDLGRVLWPVVHSAVQLLESEQRERIGQCQDDRGCGFLFLDTSRNRSRRWCSMESCGNRAKAARHHARAKG